jgi:hypothetical protein
VSKLIPVITEAPIAASILSALAATTDASMRGLKAHAKNFGVLDLGNETRAAGYIIVEYNHGKPR